MSRTLVAVAWPYANGPLHLGHVAGSLLPPDVYARFLRLTGRDCVMVSGSDMHGTPITVAAEKAGVPPEEFAARNKRLHDEALAALGIRFDIFTSTATENHRRVVHDLFLTLLRGGFIEKRPMTAPYDPRARRFLPDRYVEGTCPNCGAKDARGDQCDACGRTLDPQDLKDPRSKISGATPEWRATEHFFLRLDLLQPDLERWVDAQAERAAWRPTVVNFTRNWLKEGLRPRAITRDMTYGIPIPPEAGDFPDKRIYVWFEAVTGYLSAPQELLPGGWEPYWRESAAPRAYYFLGKDNIPFHTIVWPAMLLAYNKVQAKDGHPERALAPPWDVPANEFLQFAGAKFSKSRGNAFYVLDLLKTFDADAVRYYLTVNMPEKGDTDWTWEDFTAKVNDELVGILGNYVNRVLAFCEKNYGGIPPSADVLTGEEWRSHSESFLAPASADLHAIRGNLESTEFKRAIRTLVGVAARGNKEIDRNAPWSLVKQGDVGKAKAAQFLRSHLRIIRAITVELTPFLPNAAGEIWRQLGDAAPAASPVKASEPGPAERESWWFTDDLGPALPATGALGRVTPVFRKLDPKEVLSMFEKTPEQPAPPAAPATPTIAFDEFAKVDLRVGKVLSCEPHPKADKIWVLQVDLGAEKRQVLAGLREHVKPEELVGRNVVVVANLAPRTIRGLESQGMVLAAEEGGVVAPLTPARDVPPGAKVK